MSDTIFQFNIDGEQVTVDMSPFVAFAHTGYSNALIEANNVYLKCLKWYPRAKLLQDRIYGAKYEHYKASGAKGASGRQSKEHFEQSILAFDQEYQDAFVAYETLYRLVKDGIPTVLSPNMRGWNSVNQSAQYSSQPVIPGANQAYAPASEPPAPPGPAPIMGR